MTLRSPRKQQPRMSDERSVIRHAGLWCRGGGTGAANPTDGRFSWPAPPLFLCSRAIPR